MSNTPRTDAATVRMERLDGDIDEVVSADFARTLERENADLLEKLRAATTMPCAPCAPSATGEPVAWCVGYDDPRAGRIHSDATMNLPQAEALAERNNLALVPLYAQAAPVEERAPVDHGYDRTASLAEGRYVCTCGACTSAPLRDGNNK